MMLKESAEMILREDFIFETAFFVCLKLHVFLHHYEGGISK